MNNAERAARANIWDALDAVGEASEVFKGHPDIGFELQKAYNALCGALWWMGEP